MNCIYGFQANDLIHENLVKWFSPSLAKNIFNAISSTFPLLTILYRPSFFPSQLTQWFYDTANAAIKHRQQNPLKRNDFLNFLMENKSIKNYTNTDIGALSAIFLFDGFETTSIILAQSLYYVAKHSEHQIKLRTEISEHFPFGKCPTADTVNELQYLDNIVNGMIIWFLFIHKLDNVRLMFIKSDFRFSNLLINIETMRISPSAFLLAKNCTQSIELTDFDGGKFVVEAGTSIQLPVYAIHHDERFYDEPNSFKPQRFEFQSSNELKKNGKFLPFGDGPRICLGKLFTLNQFINESPQNDAFH